MQAQLKEAKREQAEYAKDSRVRLVSGEKKKLAASKNLSLLSKLKEAHTLGLLTDEEYERKRRAMVAEL